MGPQSLMAIPATTTTATVLPVTPVTKRGALIGTASTWKLAPFADPSVDILGLNDGYVLGGTRFTHWFDLHPFHQMVFRQRGQRVVDAAEVLAGAYLRPEGHLEWLRSRSFPVFLHEARPDWPHTQTFPRGELEAKFGRYFASTPAWMLAWMLEEGYQEIQIMGIHLATQWEYVQQRPNLEFLLGIALQRGVQIVIPNRSPLLKSKWVYAYETKPDVPIDRVQRHIEMIKRRGKGLHDRLSTLPWYARDLRQELTARLAIVNFELADAQAEAGRLLTLAQVT